MAEVPRQAWSNEMMAQREYDVIVIGAGVNGLTCAALLGKAGLRTIVLEARDVPGGCATEHELAPGFRVPTLAHRTGPLRRDVVDDLQLTDHGLRFVERAVRVTSLSPDGRRLVIYADAGETAAALEDWSARDAEAWPSFDAALARVADVIASLFTRTPPDVDRLGTDGLWTLMRALGAFRGLHREDQWRLLRWAPMAVADLVSECFETEILRATVAADGLLGAMLGPWSAGSALHLLLHTANRRLASAPDAEVEGGPAAAARALASASARHGVEVRTSAPVSRIDLVREKAAGVSLVTGESIAARAVVSGVDPKRTFLGLCSAEHLPPEFLWRIRHLRTRGTLAKVNLGLSALPQVDATTRAALASLVRIAPDLDYLERAYDHAKYGEMSQDPWIEFTIPSIADPSLAPSGAHVLSAYAQFAPHALGGASWDEARDTLGDRVVAVLDRYASGLRRSIVAREVLTPLDLEREWGLTGGHIFHGELSLDQAFTMRPLLGWGRYRTPIRGLYLCGSGTHPGTGLTGGSGANAAREVIGDLQ